MKKITLALCACAFALTGLLASCSSEAPTSVNFKDVAKINNDYVYAVKGTITTTNYEYMKTEADGTTPDKTNGKETSTKTVTKNDIVNGSFAVSWNSDENEVTNYQEITIQGDYKYNQTSTTEAKTYGDTEYPAKYVRSGSTSANWTIYEIDGEYYFVEDDKIAVKIDTLAVSEDDSVLDGDFGDEFTLKFTVVTDQATFEKVAGPGFNYEVDYTKSGNLGNVQYEAWKTKNEAGWKKTVTKEINLTFYPLQDFDPEAEVEEDEE